MQPKITILAQAREARRILRTPGLRPSLYRLARHVLGLSPARPYAGWAK